MIRALKWYLQEIIQLGKDAIHECYVVTDKSYATLIQEFFVVPPEGVETFWTWCNTAERVLKLFAFLPIYKVDLSPLGILK